MLFYIKEVFLKENKDIYYEFWFIKINYFNFIYPLKYLFFFSLIFFLFFFNYFYSYINRKIKIEIDNNFEIPIFEENYNYSNYSKRIKAIAFFYPNFIYDIKYNYYYKYIITKKNISKFKNDLITKIIIKQIELAKSHGLYGFAIYYNLEFKKETNYILEKLIYESINYPFLLIWNNENLDNIFNISLDKQQLYVKSINLLFKNIKKYLIEEIYIKINNKPVISINQPSVFSNLNEALIIFREKAKEHNVGEIFIFFPFRNIKNDSKYINLFNGTYDLSEINLFEQNRKNSIVSYYSGIIYKNIIFNKISKKFSIYRTSIVKINYNKNKIKDYSPEKFYLLNKILLEWINNNCNKNNRFLFINSWNNYIEGKYLEPDEKYGYASINSFSKALFKIPYKYNNFNISYLNDNCYIAIQAHIFYEDLIFQIIKFTNNIPFKFDLYISTISYETKIVIEKYVKNYSKANNCEIQIFKNKGRDVLPLIIQLRKKIKKYKYFCHIHTKKSKHDVILGNKWRKYLYKNMLGNNEVISEIIYDFERFDKLGFVFPEVYFEIIKKIDNYESTNFFLHKPNIKYMNLILNKIFPGFQVGEKLLFPSGNMFWAKTKAVYQIFKIKLINLFPKELNQTNKTIMHAIERIWLYLVKLNGYYYQKIFKYY